MNRCKKCILPDSVPGITFNSDGVCNFCNSFKPNKLFGKVALDQVVSQAKEQKAKYDCVVPLSGGRDSTYVLYVAKTVYNMKILAVNFNNEFMIPEAYENMVNACEILNVDFETIGSKYNRTKKVVQYELQLKAGSMCGACTYGFHSIVYAASDKHKVPLIIWGNSSLENTSRIRKAIHKKINPKNSALNKIQRRLRSYTNPYWYVCQYRSLRQRMEFPIKGNNILRRNKYRLKNAITDEISLFKYMGWNRELIKKIITSELDWRKPQGHSSTWRADCYLHLFENWKHIQKYGCTKDAFGYCNMINAQQLTRDEALKQEKEMIAGLTNDGMLTLLTERVGLTRKKSNKLISQVSNT